MSNKFLMHRIARAGWWMMVAALFALATYVAGGRYLVSHVSPWHERIVEQLNARLPFVIEASAVAGRWEAFSPVLVLQDLSVSAERSASPPISLQSGSIKLDVWNSLLSRSLQVSEATLEGVQLKGELDERGHLSIPGFGGNNSQFGEQLLDFLLNLQHLGLRDNTLVLATHDGQVHTLGMDLAFELIGGERRFSGEVLLKGSDTRFSVAGDGFGDPRNSDHFIGRLYTHFTTDQLDAVMDLLPEVLTYGVTSVTGTATVSAWLNWTSGEPRLTVQADAKALSFAGQVEQRAWQLAFDQLSFNATAWRDAQELSLVIEDVMARDDEGRWELPALHLHAHDSALSLHAKDLSVADTQRLVLASELLPDSASKVLRTLAPRGTVTALALDIDDYRRPLQTWSARARFSGVAFDSWQRGVALSNLSGFARGDHRGHGEARVDSRDFSLRLPTVYRHPLVFDSVLGDFDLDWTDHALQLKSGLIETVGEEGHGRAVLALDLPFSRTEEGPKMELLVGLRDSHPRYHHKFVPYVLPQSLRDWLSQAVEDDSAARVVDAGFLWRGSLRKHSHKQRTIQLFFDVDQLDVRFDPGWPKVTDFGGLVLIDDVRASVWADRGQLQQLDLSHLSAEADRAEDGRLLLEIAARAAGDASDGLQLINRSPLARQSGHFSADWRASGQVEGAVDLQLDLNNIKAPPRVAVNTLFKSVDITLGDLDILLKNSAGQVTYHSDKGFGSRDLTARLWGKPLALGLRPGGNGNDSDKNSLEVAFTGKVDIARIQRWLQVPTLALANGASTLSGRIWVEPGQSPLLYLSSDLQGMALDLPAPLGKTREDSRSLQLRMPLDGERRIARLVLNSDFLADIALNGRQLRGASIGLGEEPANVRSGEIHINGAVNELDVDQWQRALNQYFAPTGSDPAWSTVAIDLLTVNTLKVAGLQFDQVALDAAYNQNHWQLNAANGLARVRIAPDKTGERVVAHVPRLDLALFSGVVDNQAVGSGTIANLPDVDVTVGQLSYNSQTLGHLGFSLAAKDNTLLVDNITGEIGKLALKSDDPASLQWRGGEFGWTRFAGQLHFNDLGDVLASRDYQRIIETSEGSAMLDLTWPGNPAAIGLAQARGSMALQVGQGRFLKASAATSGALRVIGILNLAEFVSRLSLDFSSLFRSGIVFDSITGNTSLADNTLTISDVDVQGRSSRFLLTGAADVVDATMNAELAVTLPVTNNLPLVAAATGAWPLAAGLFLVGQVFEEQMNRITSAVYRIEGPWQDPTVTLGRLFDDNGDEVAKAPEDSTVQ